MHEVIFNGLSVATRPGRVMIPRATSEHLIDAARAVAGDRPLRIADVGTGSGAIAVALAVALPGSEIFATDSSAAAVLLARANVARLGLGARVTVLQGDLLDPVPAPLDLVVANLPYLPLGEAGLHPDLAEEPPEAVFCPGDGLDVYRRLIAQARERLTPDGALVIQFRRDVLTGTLEELDELAARLEQAA